uniref:Uncharacterized protein n=1 Tax=Anguilla anguilla TaxID=7936 RepID=A0A0E9R931_ANGAN
MTGFPFAPCIQKLFICVISIRQLFTVTGLKMFPIL